MKPNKIILGILIVSIFFISGCEKDTNQLDYIVVYDNNGCYVYDTSGDFVSFREDYNCELYIERQSYTIITLGIPMIVETPENGYCNDTIGGMESETT